MALEGTGQRPANSRKGGGRIIAQPNGPTTRSRLVTRPVPEAVAPTGRIETLGNALAGFFNVVGGALDKAADAEHALNRLEIQQENADAQNAGRKAALLGEPIPEDKKGNKAFVQGYEAVSVPREAAKKRRDEREAGIAAAQRGEKPTTEQAKREEFMRGYLSAQAESTARDHALEWQTQVLPKLGPNDDVEATYRAFVESKMKRGKDGGFGTNNNLYDGTYLKVLNDATRRSRGVGRMAALKGQMVERMATVKANVFNALEAGGAFDYAKYLEQARAADPRLSEGQYRAMVAQQALAWAARTGSPQRVHRVDELLQNIGFAEQYPAQYVEHLQKLQQIQMSVRTEGGQKAYQQYGASLTGWTAFAPSDFEGRAKWLAERHKELGAIYQQHGGQGLYKSSFAAWSKIATAYAKERAEINEVMRLAPKGMWDVDKTKKHIDTLAKRFFTDDKGQPVDPRVAPQRYAAFLKHFGANNGTVSSDIKATLTGSLTDLSDGKFTATMQTLVAFANANNGQASAALQLIDGSAHGTFMLAWRQHHIYGLSFDAIRDRMLKAQDALAKRKAGGMNFKDMLQTTDSNESSRGKVEDRIALQLKESFPGLDRVDPTVRRNLALAALDDWVLSGGQKWQDVVDASVAAVKAGGRYTLTPGPNDKVEIRRSRIPPHGSLIQRGTDLGIGAAGRTTSRTAVRFGETVVNRFGEVENTIETYRADLKTLLGDIIPGAKLGAGEISLNDNHPFAALKGIYLVQRGKGLGQEFRFNAGETITVNGKKITLAENIDERIEQLNKAGIFDASTAIRKEAAVAKGLRDTDVGSLGHPSDFGLRTTISQRVRTLDQRFVLFKHEGELYLGYRPGFVEDVSPAERGLSARETVERARVREEGAKKSKKISDETQVFGP